jgi:Na+/melibiose symporter-like transporter
MGKVDRYVWYATLGIGLGFVLYFINPVIAIVVVALSVIAGLVVTVLYSLFLIIKPDKHETEDIEVGE